MPYKTKTSGVYVITNEETSEQYVGSTVYLEHHWSQYRYEARRGRLSSPLFRAMRQYGEEVFSYEWLETCSKKKLEKREGYWIGYLDTTYPNGYNVGSFHGPLTKEMLAKFPRGGVVEIGPYLTQKTITKRKKNKAYREQFDKNKKIATAKSLKTRERHKKEDPEYEERLRKKLSKATKRWWKTGKANPAKGEACATSKLTEKNVKRMFRLRASGYTVRKIAKIYQIDESGVSRILRRHSWKHVKIE